MKDLITEARELIEALHAGEYDDEYIGTGAYLMLDELCDALEKAEEQNKQLMHEVCRLACESVEREKTLARLEADVVARLEERHEAD
jgi:hypothetical protein